MVIEFDNATGLKKTDGASPTGFQVAGNDKLWRSVTATIQGSTVELAETGVYVRYAFAGKPTVNLVNGANLPAHPFRTDSATTN